MKPLPEELARKIEAALGREVPPPEDREGWKELAKEVATRAPHLYRQLMDALNEAQVRAVRARPEPRSARPPGLRGAFYVRGKDGNWVPSRSRVLAAIVLGAALSTAPLLWFMMLTDAKQKAVIEGGEAPAAVSPGNPFTAADTPPLAAPAKAKEAEGGETAREQSTQSALKADEAPLSKTPVEIQAPPPAPEQNQAALPSPPPDLPPPPDYEGQGQQPSVSVVYRRPVGTASGQGGGAVDLRSLRRGKVKGGANASSDGVVYAAAPGKAGGDGVWVMPAAKAGAEDGVYVLGRSTPSTTQPAGEEVYVRKTESGGDLKVVYSRPISAHSDKP